MFKLARKKVQSDKGMTMAEMLAVVAIMVILMGVAFVAIMTYMRSMAQLERDSIAKEILVAAQNHLTVAKGEGYPGIDENIFASDEKEDKKKADKAAGTEDPDQPGVYYITVNSGEVQNKDVEGNKLGEYMWETMLPFGSLEEVVRDSGNYVISYQPNIGKVLDVFYCSSDHSEDASYSGYDSRYGYSFKEEDYNNAGEFSLSGLRNKKDDTKEQKKEKKEKRREYKSDYVLGWYGGDGIDVLAHKIKAPKIKLHNGNKLYVSTEYADEDDYNDASIRIIVEGKQSGAKSFFDTEKKTRSGISDKYEAEDVVLDDITTNKTHFHQLLNENPNKDNDTSDFIPGEDIKVRAIAYSSTKIANIAESNIKEGNSLFENIADEDNDKAGGGSDLDDQYNLNGETVTIESSSDEIYDTAYIGNFRHLENLDKYVSNLDANDGEGSDKKLSFKKAIQTDDMDWNDYFADKAVYYSASDTYFPTSHTGTGFYKPVGMPDEKGNGFIYNGRSSKKTHEIAGVKINVVQEDSSNPLKYDAGLFHGVKNSKIKNLKLKTFNVQSTISNDAGALADSLTGSTVSNITANDITISASKDDGLVGTVSNSTIEKIVMDDFEVQSGSGNAGALAKSLSGSTVSDITATNIKVKASKNAGLIGASANSKIEKASLEAFDIESTTGDAGALAESLTGNAGSDRSRATDITAKNIKVKASKNAGLTGISTYSRIEKAQIENAVIVSDVASAGTLIGSMTGGSVNNTISYNTTDTGALSVSSPVPPEDWDEKTNINPEIRAGGLIGSMKGGTVEFSAAAVRVFGEAAAGGLVGYASDGAVINGCYAGGHTKDGQYEKWIDDGKRYDVKGYYAGGFAGVFNGSTVQNSYTTCSVHGSSREGGFAGESNGTIGNCYSTGLINPTNAVSMNAFVGSGTPTASGNKYYSSVNADQELSDDYAEPFDTDTDTLKAFTSQVSEAEPYDSFIRAKYGNGYILRSVTGLIRDLYGSSFSFPSNYDEYFINTHYGDWPSPEVFIVNE